MQRKFKKLEAIITGEDGNLKEKIIIKIGPLDLTYQEFGMVLNIFVRDRASQEIIAGKSSYETKMYKDKFRDAFVNGDIDKCLSNLDRFKDESEMVAAICTAMKTMMVVTPQEITPTLAVKTVADALCMDPLAQEKIIPPNEPMGIIAARTSELRLSRLKYKKTTGTTKPKEIENLYSLETLQKLYAESEVPSIPSVLVFANANRPGGERVGVGQEENILANSNLSFGMPDSYADNNIWTHCNGIYAVLCHTNKDDLPFWAIVMAAPNLNQESMKFITDKEPIVTPSDAALFGITKFRPDLCSRPKSYMLHVLGEVVMQFYMAKILGSKHFITGQFGAGVFNGNPEYYAAAVKFVSQLVKFADLKVVCALGADKEAISGRKINAIFGEPKAELIILARDLYVENFGPYEIIADESLALNAISKKVSNFYQQDLPAEIQAMRVPPQEPNLVAPKRDGMFKSIMTALFLPAPLEKNSPHP